MGKCEGGELSSVYKQSAWDLGQSPYFQPKKLSGNLEATLRATVVVPTTEVISYTYKKY